MSPQVRQRSLASEIDVLTFQHAFGGVRCSIRKQLGTYQVDEIMASALKTFGHGTKVAMKPAMMAADAGLIGTDLGIMSTGGAGQV